MVNILVFSPHPDDAELCIGGIIVKHSKKYKVMIVDITSGENSINGNKLERIEESKEAAKKLNVNKRICLDIPDCDIRRESNEQEKMLIKIIRQYRPSIVLSSYVTDYHPDHKETYYLVRTAIMKAGLNIYKELGELYVCKNVYYYAMDLCKTGNSFCVDVSNEYNMKRAALSCYKSQFLLREGNDSTFLNKGIINQVESKNAYLGSLIGVKYAEELIYEGNLMCENIFDLIKFK